MSSDLWHTRTPMSLNIWSQEGMAKSTTGWVMPTIPVSGRGTQGILHELGGGEEFLGGRKKSHTAWRTCPNNGSLQWILFGNFYRKTEVMCSGHSQTLGPDLSFTSCHCASSPVCSRETIKTLPTGSMIMWGVKSPKNCVWGATQQALPSSHLVRFDVLVGGGLS